MQQVEDSKFGVITMRDCVIVVHPDLAPIQIMRDGDFYKIHLLRAAEVVPVQ